jgi:WhiB family transcriptional regulator, redox-sensing transcriptional regulator
MRLDTVTRGGITFQRRARSTAVDRDEHGTLARYTTWGCRCSRCRTARRNYDRALRAARRLVATGIVRRRVPVDDAAVALTRCAVPVGRCAGLRPRWNVPRRRCTGSNVPPGWVGAGSGRILRPGWWRWRAVSDWRSEAACRGRDSSWWLDDRAGSWESTVAVQVCRRCPVRGECLAFAIDVRAEVGIFGATTPAERSRLVRGRT